MATVQQYREAGWTFRYDAGSETVIAEHTSGGKQTMCRVVAPLSSGMERSEVGGAIVETLNVPVPDRRAIGVAAAVVEYVVLRWGTEHPNVIGDHEFYEAVVRAVREVYEPGA